ncbi:hypothetical protein Franean1_5113 [Parafrankia sp. EAN1pec]|nr:hypothetical protein Franean1_5113 [Frankia sp. EAN1pec]
MALIVRGRLESAEGVVDMIVESLLLLLLLPLPLPLAVGGRSRDFR